MSEDGTSNRLLGTSGAQNGDPEGEPVQTESITASRRSDRARAPELTPMTNSSAWKYDQAAIYMQEGLDHSKFAYHPRTREAVEAYKTVNSVWLNLVDITAGIVLMILAFFEEPAVCPTCTNINATAIVEILCLLATHIHTFYYFRWKGKAVFKEKKLIIKMILTVEMLIEAIVVLGRQDTHLRFMRSFRPIFIIDNKFAKGIKRVLYEMVQSLPPVIEILVLLITFITTFAVMGYYLFGTQRVDPYTQDSHNWYFYSFQDSWVNLFILLTTANYPDVMMPAYRDSRWAALFFVIYLMFALYFLGNLLLAAVYSNFNTKEKDKFGRLFIHRRQGLRKAFEVVGGTEKGHLDYEVFQGIVSAYTGKSQFEIVCMFKTMERDGNNGVDLESWFNFYEVSLYRWREDRGHSSGLFCSVELYPPTIMPFFVVLNRVVTHRFFEYFIDFCIVVNAAFLIAEAALTTDDNKDHHAIADYEQVFITIYTLEAVMKICGIGFYGYFSKGFNIFDFIIVAVSLLGQAVEKRTIYVTILRPFRLFRLFKLRKSFNQILSAMFNIIPRLGRFVLTMICVYYFFSIIAMSSFAGDISTCGCVHYQGRYQCEAELFQANQSRMVYVTKANTALNSTASTIRVAAVCNDTIGCTYKQCGGHYDGYYDRSSADGLYYLNNFDDIVSSYVVLFELMIVNNWHVTMQGTVSSTASRTVATRAFFILFYLVTVVIVTNVVVAFILDAFQSLLPTLQAKEERQAERRRKRAEQDLPSSRDDDDDDDSDELVKYVYLLRSTAESLDDPKFVSKMKKKSTGSLEVKFLGTRRIQPIDIYLLIFGDDIDEWKSKETELSNAGPRERLSTFADHYPHDDRDGAVAHETHTLSRLSMAVGGGDSARAGSVSYTAPAYTPATTTSSA